MKKYQYFTHNTTNRTHKCNDFIKRNDGYISDEKYKIQKNHLDFYV